VCARASNRRYGSRTPYRSRQGPADNRASRSFYVKFTTNRRNRASILQVGPRGMDIPSFACCWKDNSDHGTLDDYEVEHDSSRFGKRALLLNASIVLYEKDTRIFARIEDITVSALWNVKRMNCCGRRTCCSMKSTPRRNSLQIIASIIMLKAKSWSRRRRRHLHDAHNRVISVARATISRFAGLGRWKCCLFNHALWRADAFDDWRRERSP